MTEDTTTNNNSLATIKIGLAIAIFALGLLSVLAPQWLASGCTTAHWFSMGNMAASGVLLSAGLVHMLADSGAVLNPGNFPMANFVAGLTFIGFMVLEESMHLLFMTLESDDDEGGGLLSQVIMAGHDHGHGNHGNPESSGHNHSHAHQGEESNHSHSHDHQPTNESQPLSSSSHQKYVLQESQDSVELPPPILKSSFRSSRRATSCGGCGSGYYPPNTYGRPSSQSPIDVHHRASEPIPNTSLSSRLTVRPPDQHHHHHDDHIELHLHGSSIAATVLMAALSIHSVLAGVSIGIDTSPQALASTAAAILAHKSFEGFCLGASLVNAQLIMGGGVFWGLTLGFALATPCGIAVGQGILVESTATDHNNRAIIALVQAMCAGTFLYIAIVEIGGKELLACRHDDGEHGSKWQKQLDVAKLICFVAGFLAMSALALVV